MTDFDALRRSWREECPKPARTPSDSVAQVRSRAMALSRSVRRRDRVETGVALLLLPFFLWVAVREPSPVSTVGALVAAVWCVMMPLHLRRVRGQATDPGRPITDFLRAELARARAQRQLLGSVAWWYVAPITLGVLLIVGGGDASPGFKAGYTIAVLLLGAVVLLLNRRAAAGRLQPIIDELQRRLAELESRGAGGSSSGGSEP